MSQALYKSDTEGEIGICINPIYWGHDIATELGLLGLILFLIALFGALWASFRKWYSTDDASYLAAHMALVYFLGHGFFEAPIFSIHVLPVFLLLVAFCFAKNDDREYL